MIHSVRVVVWFTLCHPIDSCGNCIVASSLEATTNTLMTFLNGAVLENGKACEKEVLGSTMSTSESAIPPPSSKKKRKHQPE